ncbi:MAG: hypothetical protein ACYCQJ_15160 [Nitrososphaerales archaeon]
MKDYRMVCGARDTFENAVKSHLEFDWTPIGGVSIIPGAERNTYCQALIKEDTIGKRPRDTSSDFITSKK